MNCPYKSPKDWRGPPQERDFAKLNNPLPYENDIGAFN